MHSGRKATHGQASRAKRSATPARAALAVALALMCVLTLAATAQAKRKFHLPKVRHVFVILLENQGYKETFEKPSNDPYLATTLPSQGALLEQYFAIGHLSNDNYIALASGQPPNPETQGDCMNFNNFLLPKEEPGGIEGGQGCVYPANVQSIGNQLTAAGLSWKAYMQDMGNNPKRESAACGHPEVGKKDETQSAEAGDEYAARHNPFVYFHSVIDDQAYCNAHVVALGEPNGDMPPAALPGETGLATDLLKAKKTPAFSFITPNLCFDGHDAPPCKSGSKAASVFASMDAFLETWVPKITSSPAYKKGGLLEIVFDEAGNSETEACCGETPGPNSPKPGITGPGGGRVGGVMLSRFIKPGTVSKVAYNHYSSLASWETLFGLPRLADAASVTSSFGADVYTASK
jgi:phosphatidylinositol-3-phosphatase